MRGSAYMPLIIMSQMTQAPPVDDMDAIPLYSVQASWIRNVSRMQYCSYLQCVVRPLMGKLALCAMLQSRSCCEPDDESGLAVHAYTHLLKSSDQAEAGFVCI